MSQPLRGKSASYLLVLHTARCTPAVHLETERMTNVFTPDFGLGRIAPRDMQVFSWYHTPADSRRRSLTKYERFGGMQQMLGQ